MCEDAFGDQAAGVKGHSIGLRGSLPTCRVAAATKEPRQTGMAAVYGDPPHPAEQHLA